MSATDFRNQTADSLQKQVSDKKTELATLHREKRSSEEKNSMKKRGLRREIAQILTVLNEAPQAKEEKP